MLRRAALSNPQPPLPPSLPLRPEPRSQPLIGSQPTSDEFTPNAATRSGIGRRSDMAAVGHDSTATRSFLPPLHAAQAAITADRKAREDSGRRGVLKSPGSMRPETGDSTLGLSSSPFGLVKHHPGSNSITSPSPSDLGGAKWAAPSPHNSGSPRTLPMRNRILSDGGEALPLPSALTTMAAERPSDSSVSVGRGASATSSQALSPSTSLQRRQHQLQAQMRGNNSSAGSGSLQAVDEDRPSTASSGFSKVFGDSFRALSKRVRWTGISFNSQQSSTSSRLMSGTSPVVGINDKV